MPARRRILVLIAALVAVVALVAVILRHRAPLPTAGAPPGAATPRPGATSRGQAPTTPDVSLLAAQNLEYAPDLDPLDVESFLRSIGSDLADYVVARGEQRVRFADLVAAAAERHAVNPRVLLVLMELATGVVSNPSPDLVMRAAGYPPHVAPDAEAQVERLAATVSSHYVAAFMGDEPVAVQGPDGDAVQVVAAAPAAAAIARTLAETMSVGALSEAVEGPRPGFRDVYQQWFGDPTEVPIFAQGVALPVDAAWPFEGAKRHTGGPHLGAFCSQQDVSAASGLDFGGESHEVLAMADGRYLGRGETTAAGYQAGKYVLLEHDGGVQVMYWHLAGFSPEVLALAPGADIPKGFPVGWSGRSGNQSAVHLHVELRRGAVATNPYSGVRVAWDGQVVDGWTVRMFRWPGRDDRGISYRGSVVRGAARVLSMGNCACDQASADALVSSQHPSTSAPRNGMDANTVLANYPDVGLLPSSNVRTTALWTTAERAWRHRLRWYYLIDARDGGVGEVRLDDEVLFAAPACARAVWLAPGEHRLTWRYREGDGAGESAVRLLPWPFEAPACAASSLDAPPDHAAPPAAPHDDAAWVAAGEQIALVRGTAGGVVTATWRLRNTGTVPWGDGYRLTLDDGWPLGTGEEARLPAAAPGDEVTIPLPVTVPLDGGVAHAVWRLRNPDGVAFGPPLGVAVEGTSEAMGAPPEAPADGAPALVEPVAGVGEVAYLDRREVTLRWTGVADAEGYVLHLSLLPNPADDASPVYRERLDRGVHERRLTFSVDVPRLYWQVTALTAGGEAQSGVSAFGLDTEAPTCSAGITAGDAGARVVWQGDDAVSGIASYDVAYRLEGESAWRPLLTDGLSAGEAPFAAPLGGTYAVRCRARDVAGNVGAWSDDDGATVSLGAGAQAQVTGSGLTVTALPANRLLVEAPVSNVAGVPGDARLALVLESGIGRPQVAHRWDVAALAPGKTITLTAVVDGPVGPAAVGEPLGADYRFSIQSRDDAGAQLTALTEACLAAPDPYEVWESHGDGLPAGAALWPGRRQTRGFHAPGDVDEARVAAQGGRSYLLWAEGASAHAVLELYDAAGTLVGHSANASGLGERIAWQAPADGIYRVVVRPWAPGSEGCGSEYALRLQAEPPVPELPEGKVIKWDIQLPLILRQSGTP